MTSINTDKKQTEKKKPYTHRIQEYWGISRGFDLSFNHIFMSEKYTKMMSNTTHTQLA